MSRPTPCLLAAALCSACATARGGRRAPATSEACAASEHRQLDFWIGDWDLVIRTRESPDPERWRETRGTNHVRAVLRGCVIEEDFAADPGGEPWAGRSVSTFVPRLGVWRQTWVDDQ